MSIYVTVDIVALSLVNNKLSTLLIKRKSTPFKNQWAIPGGFVDPNETLEEAAKRELQEETNIKPNHLEQLYTFGNPKRDPRGRIITVAYLALLAKPSTPQADSDAKEAQWKNIYSLPSLAFDHKGILSYALKYFRNNIQYTTIGFKLLPDKFTLSELQNVYESVLNKKLDKQKFQRKIMTLGVLTPLKQYKKESENRPEKLFKLSSMKFKNLKNKIFY